MKPAWLSLCHKHMATGRINQAPRNCFWHTLFHKTRAPVRLSPFKNRRSTSNGLCQIRTIFSGSNNITFPIG